MLDNEKLDDLYRNKFNDFELPVSDELLSAIKKELVLPENKKRIVYWKWILSGFLFSAGLALAYFIIPVSDKNQHTNQRNFPVTNIETKSIINSVTSHSIISENISETANYELAENNIKNSSHTKQPDRKDSQESNNKANILQNEETHTNANKTISIAKENKNNYDKKVKSIANKKTAYSEKSKVKSDEANKLNNLSSSSEANMSANENEKQTSINQNQPVDESLQIGKSLSNKTPPTIVPNNSDKPETKNKDLNKSGDSLLLAKDSLVNEKKMVAIDSTKEKNTGKTQENKTSEFSKIRFFIDLNGGLSSSYRSLKGTDSIIVSRNDAEKKTTTYSGGVDFGVILKNKILVNTGIGIENKGEKYSYEGLEAKYVITGYNYNWDSLNQKLDTVPIYDTKPAVQAKAAQNKYQFLRIPVMFGYCFTFKEKWFVNPSAGVTINYLLSASSSWLDSSSRQYVYYNKSDHVFSSFSIAGRIQLDLGFNINNNWSICVRPGYTRFFQSIYLKDDNKKLYPYSYDLNLGVTYKF
jgi:hypothetical protein